MPILVIAEHDNAHLKASTHHTLAAAQATPRWHARPAHLNTNNMTLLNRTDDVFQFPEKPAINCR